MFTESAASTNNDKRRWYEVDRIYFAFVRIKSTQAWSIWRTTELNLEMKARRLLFLPILLVKRVTSLTFSWVDP